MIAQLEQLESAFINTISPDEDLFPSKWAETYRVVSSEATGATMKWENTLAPYMVEIMDTFHPSCPSEYTVFKKPTQVAASESMNNLAGWIIHQQKKSLLLTLPTIDSMQFYSDTRIKTMIRDTPVLKALISDNSRDETNQKLFKMFPGGFFRMSGANSATSLKSLPVPYFLGDEVNEWPEDCDGQGSPLGIAAKRTDRYSDHKIWLSSTPTKNTFSLISNQYEMSSKALYHVPCLKCGTHQPLEWTHLVYKGLPYPKYECDKCNHLIDEADKFEMLIEGKWVHEHPDRWKRRGFWLNGLYSPVGFSNTWENMAVDWQEAMVDLKKRKKLTLVVFKNNRLAQDVAEDELEDEPDVEDIQKRCEAYPEFLDNKIKLLTCSIDIQDKWVEAEIMGWGKGKENWSIDWMAFEGSPGVPINQGVWEQLAFYIQKTFVRQDETVLKISTICVDTGGHHTTEAYNFCSAWRGLGVVATKGSNTHGSPLIKRGQGKTGIRLYMIGTVASKDTLFSHLNVTEQGPGYCHFPQSNKYNDEYFKQLFAEEVVKRRRDGREVRVYVKRRARNEKLDLRSMNYVALQLADPKGFLINQDDNSKNYVLKSNGRRVLSKGV